VETTIRAAAQDPAGSGDARAGKYLVFQLGREEFAIRVQNVREIMRVQDITVVPQTPPHVKGVINLRGKVIPVVDLRLKFGLPPLEYTERTCIVVVRIDGTASMTGIVVDGVTEVLNLPAAEIEDIPDFGHEVATPYLLGMAKIKGQVKILLDIAEVLSRNEFQSPELLLSQEVTA
jgi:purine-binding chemotaxis protein CheW